MTIRLAVDARKLTDFGIGTYLSHLLSGLAWHDEFELTVVIRPEHVGRVAALAPEARTLPVSARGYGIGEHIALPAALWRERLTWCTCPTTWCPSPHAAADRGNGA